KAAQIAGLSDDIAGFPNGFDQLVGERGITLSGGQKQRVAIARAIIRNPRILVLDDSLSAVDTYTEEKILRNLRDVRRGRTTLIVSHRISTIRDADLICVLRDG
ncbi:MAG: ABC transporter ATP-binding protein, partial [Blastocatellia bacterium]